MRTPDIGHLSSHHHLLGPRHLCVDIDRIAHVAGLELDQLDGRLRADRFLDEIVEDKVARFQVSSAATS